MDSGPEGIPNAGGLAGAVCGPGRAEGPLMDLSTRYLGLALRNPLVASASPLSNTLDGVRRLAGAGVGAVVLFSLFEEQLRQEAGRNARLADAGTDSFAESLSYFPAGADEDTGPRRYLSLLERAAAAVDIPVIGSLNGVTRSGWTGYARAMQDAGAAAIELNIYFIAGDPRMTGREVEQRHLDILCQVKDAVTVPVAPSITHAIAPAIPARSSFTSFAARLLMSMSASTANYPRSHTFLAPPGGTHGLGFRVKPLV